VTIARETSTATFTLWALLCLGVCVAAEAVRYAQQPLREPVTLALAPLPANDAPRNKLPVLTLLSNGLIPAPEGAPSAHASTLAQLPGGELLALWWAGARESAPDVAVYASRWNGTRWSAPSRVVERHQLGRQLGFGVRRLGNPVAWVAGDGRVHLYLVATGLGGWAASRVVHMISDDAARSFAAQRVLALSPLFNTSTLVRTAAVATTDGGWLLPAYFELGNKYPLLIAMDVQGVPRWSRRIGASRSSLQPALMAVSPTEVHALMRDHGEHKRIQAAISRDAGETWLDQAPLPQLNHDSSVAAIRLADGGFVMAHNDQFAALEAGRHWLRLSVSDDARHWHASEDVVRGALGDEFSYPSLLQVGRLLHVTFTAQRGAIGHHVYAIAAAPATP
jgi:predicted neuraminidase